MVLTLNIQKEVVGLDCSSDVLVSIARLIANTVLWRTAFSY